MTFQPKSIDTSNVALPPELGELVELFARHSHDTWAARRLAEGWVWGPKRDDSSKKHPCLVSYDELPESEKQYDREAVTECLKALLALGYRIGKP